MGPGAEAVAERRRPASHIPVVDQDPGARASRGLAGEVSNRRPGKRRLEVPRRPSPPQGRSGNSAAKPSQRTAPPPGTTPQLLPRPRSRRGRRRLCGRGAPQGAERQPRRGYAAGVRGRLEPRAPQSPPRDAAVTTAPCPSGRPAAGSDPPSPPDEAGRGPREPAPRPERLPIFPPRLVDVPVGAASHFAPFVLKQILHPLPLRRQLRLEIIIHCLLPP